jgi:hypothetical protein
MGGLRVVTTAAQLIGALQSGSDDIESQGTLSGMPMITLDPGGTLRGGTPQFGAKGVRLTRDNVLDGVTVLTVDDEVAVLNDTSVTDLGKLTPRNVRTVGQVLLQARDAVRTSGENVIAVEIEGDVGKPSSWAASRPMAPVPTAFM